MNSVVKLVVVGDASVGKTSLLLSYVKNEFSEGYTPTVFETFQTLQVVDGQTLSLELWDTAGSEDYNTLRSVSYANVDVFLICYAIDGRNSFNNISTEWSPEVSKYTKNNTATLLVGLKSDLREGSPTGTLVSEAEGLRLATHISADDYVECSARSRTNIDLVFEKATRAVLKKRTINKKARKRNRCIIL